MSDADLGGDPPCWAHLFEDVETDDADTDTDSDTDTEDAEREHNGRDPRMTSNSPLDDADLAQLMNGLADAVIVADPNGTIVYWNGAAERIFGWTAEHAIGESLDLIVPEKQRRAHGDGYARVMQTGVTRYGDDLLRVPSLHADGQRRSIAFTVTLIKDPSGAVTGIAAVVRDETQRWADEQALRHQLRDAQA